MSVVCHDQSFLESGGELTLSRVGAWRPLQTAYQPSSSDGPFGQHPAPGKTVIDIDATWINTTNVPHVVWGWLDRAPWTIIATNVQNVRFQERYSYAVGVNPRAATPASSGDSFGSNMDNWGTYFFWWVTQAARATVSFGSQDRGAMMLTPVQTVLPGAGLNIRYQVNLVADFTPVAGGVPRSESYARWAQVQIMGGPAAA